MSGFHRRTQAEIDGAHAWCVLIDTSQHTAPFFARFGFEMIRVIADGYPPDLDNPKTCWPVHFQAGGVFRPRQKRQLHCVTQPQSKSRAAMESAFRGNGVVLG
jgi:hypothetical protein